MGAHTGQGVEAPSEVLNADDQRANRQEARADETVDDSGALQQRADINLTAALVDAGVRLRTMGGSVTRLAASCAEVCSVLGLGGSARAEAGLEGLSPHARRRGKSERAHARVVARPGPPGTRRKSAGAALGSS